MNMERKGKFFYVDYNAAFIARYKTLKGALNFIQRKGLRDDLDNTLRVFDIYGNMYDPTTGEELG